MKITCDNVAVCACAEPIQYENEAAHSLEDAIRAYDLISLSGSVITSDRRRKEKRGFVVKMSTVFIAMWSAEESPVQSIRNTNWLDYVGFTLVILIVGSIWNRMCVGMAVGNTPVVSNL